jgi:hypothetical protein
MAATQQDIRRWLDSGKAEGASHVIIVCDTYDYDDYPVYVKPEENARDKAAEYNKKSMQRVMEVYNLGKDIDKQLSDYRAFNY